MATQQETIISLVIPVRNEVELLPELFKKLDSLKSELLRRETAVEIIINNNASADGSTPLLRQWERQSEDHRVHHFPSMKSFQASIIHGLRSATGDAVVVVQGDMQDPIELIPEMVEKWKEGKRVVVGEPTTEAKPILYKLGAGNLFRVLSWSARQTIPSFKDFYLLDRSVYSEISTYRAEFQFMRSIIASDYGIDAVLRYERAPRVRGTSKFRFFDLYELGLDALLVRSQRFLQMLSLGAALLALVSLVSGLVLVATHFFGLISAPVGWTSLTVLLLLSVGLGGLMFAAVLGYLYRVLMLLLRPDKF